MSEIHHVFEALASFSYDPGVVTSFFYFGFGVALLVETLRKAGVRMPRLVPRTAEG